MVPVGGHDYIPSMTADPRILLTRDTEFAGLIATILRDERSVESTWSHPNVPLLIFSDHVLPGSSVTFHGGPIGTGLPVQLIYWGSWWTTPEGVARQVLIDSRVQALIASDYFVELTQYGIARPSWRGSIVCTQPAPRMAFNNNEDQHSVVDLVDALVDDDVFPDPDDERIAYVVLMPKGFTQTVDANGAHTADWYWDFLDTDYYWVAWIRYFEDFEAEETVRTLSHELVETFTDPESDGWYASSASTGEIGDAAVSAGKKQEAWVNGARASAYWSNAHHATVLPIDRDYRARFRGSLAVSDRRDLEHGTFRPDHSEAGLCRIVPACCLEDRDYRYWVTGRDESVTLRLETTRYREPTAAWSVGGTDVAGSGQLTLSLLCETFAGRTSHYAVQPFTVHYEATATTLRLWTSSTAANADVDVRARVTDASIVGNLATNVVATPAATVGFVGTELTIEQAYLDQVHACGKALRDMFNRVEIPDVFHRPKPGDPVELAPWVLAALPAFVRVERYRALRETASLARAAGRVLGPEEGAVVQQALLARDSLLTAVAQVEPREDASEPESSPQEWRD